MGNWELGTGQLKSPNPLANWGSGKLKLKLKLKSKSQSYPVPKSLHVSYLIFCYKLKDFNDTLDDGDDRSANWNCLLKVRITEQPARQAGQEYGHGHGHESSKQGQHLGPARDPNEADSRAGTSMGAKMPRNGQPGKTNRMRCVPPSRPRLQVPHPAASAAAAAAADCRKFIKCIYCFD